MNIILKNKLKITLLVLVLIFSIIILIADIIQNEKLIFHYWYEVDKNDPASLKTWRWAFSLASSIPFYDMIFVGCWLWLLWYAFIWLSNNKLTNKIWLTIMVSILYIYKLIVLLNFGINTIYEGYLSFGNYSNGITYIILCKINFGLIIYLLVYMLNNIILNYKTIETLKSLGENDYLSFVKKTKLTEDEKRLTIFSFGKYKAILKTEKNIAKIKVAYLNVINNNIVWDLKITHRETPEIINFVLLANKQNAIIQK